jgi:nucleoside-diphosphate-sugar epimerase
MTRIGITGATGIVGRALQRHWRDVEWLPFTGDVRDLGGVHAWLDAAQPEAVIHLAAIVPVKRVEQSPHDAFAVNAGGTLNVAEAVRTSARRCWLFVASTSHVYAPSAVPVAEDAALDPISLYGATKLQSEQIALTYARHFGLEVCVGRIFSFSDPRQAREYFIPSTIARIRRAARGEELTIEGGNQARDFLTTERIAAAVKTLFARRVAGIYNIASGRGATLVDVAARLCARLGRDDVRVVAAGGASGALVANVDKLQALGWSPEAAIDQLLDEMTGETTA